jgi:hypothetical protein
MKQLKGVAADCARQQDGLSPSGHGQASELLMNLTTGK